jgi:hypothetical protein
MPKVFDTDEIELCECGHPTILIITNLSPEHPDWIFYYCAKCAKTLSEF